jgi:type IV secretion system protein VirD4
MSSIVPFRPSPLHGLLLGYSDVRNATPQPIWDHGDEGHLITVGPTGSGKGVSCVIPALLTWSGPAVVIDPRGEIAAVTASHREKMGHTIHVLDPFEVTDGLPRARLNPLDLARFGSPTFEDDLAVIGNLLKQGVEFRNDPFWDERATSLITDVIFNLILQKDHLTLADVQEFLEEGEHFMFDLGGGKNGNLRAPSLNFSKYGSDRTRSSIFSTASSHLGFAKSEAVHDSLSDSTISLDDITEGAPLTIYLVLPPDKLRSHGKLLRLWIGVMLAAIARRRTKPKLPTLFMVDEAAQLGELEELRSALTLMRGYGCRVWTIWQDLSQLRATYPHDWESILNNSVTQMFFPPATPSAQRQLEEYLGSYAPKRMSSLKPSEGMMCRNGKLEIVTRVDYRTDAHLRRFASPHPFHPSPEGAVVPFAQDKASSASSAVKPQTL